ncbi:hypothetical protein V8E54_013486 [Elaphomyces granulatus]
MNVHMHGPQPTGWKYWICPGGLVGKGALWVLDAYAKDKTFKRMKGIFEDAAAASAARLGDTVVMIRSSDHAWTIDPNTNQQRPDERHITITTDGGKFIHVYLGPDNIVKGESVCVNGQLNPGLSVGSFQYRPPTQQPRARRRTMKLSTKNVESINRADKEFGNFGITWRITLRHSRKGG